MYFENVDDFHRGSASYPAMVDGKRGIPLLRLQSHNHPHQEAPAKFRRKEMSRHISFHILEINYL